MEQYKLVSREHGKEGSVISISPDVSIGGGKILIIAGPCSIEGYEMLLSLAKIIKVCGCTALRGGAYKPRTSPYDFQGLGSEGLKILYAVSNETNLATVTEVIDPRDVELVVRYTDVVQVGARNMQNYALLKEVGKSCKPILLKRGISSTINEWLMAAEYIMASGNSNVMLCERGIRTFETATRNTLDINAVPILKQKTHLPVLIDPSHGTGHSSIVSSIAKAGVAAGADGLLIEVHENPEKAWSDGEQSLNPISFAKLMQELPPVAQAVGRTI